jgi:hypothetical protein
MSTQSITAPPHTRAARHSYPIEMALFTEELSCGQLLAALVATGHTPPLLTLDDVIFIKRRCTRLVRSCSLDTRYGCILVEETCIIAQAPRRLCCTAGSEQTAVQAASRARAAAPARPTAVSRRYLQEFHVDHLAPAYQSTEPPVTGHHRFCSVIGGSFIDRRPIMHRRNQRGIVVLLTVFYSLIPYMPTDRKEDFSEIPAPACLHGDQAP